MNFMGQANVDEVMMFVNSHKSDDISMPCHPYLLLKGISNKGVSNSSLVTFNHFGQID